MHYTIVYNLSGCNTRETLQNCRQILWLPSASCESVESRWDRDLIAVDGNLIPKQTKPTNSEAVSAQQSEWASECFWTSSIEPESERASEYPAWTSWDLNGTSGEQKECQSNSSSGIWPRLRFKDLQEIRQRLVQDSQETHWAFTPLKTTAELNPKQTIRTIKQRALLALLALLLQHCREMSDEHWRSRQQQISDKLSSSPEHYDL